MKRNLVIADLPLNHGDQPDSATLTREQMQRIDGGRNIVVSFEGGPGTATVNDFDLNNAIWEGRVGGPMIN